MAIDEIYDDHEQSERVRDWLRRNILGLVGGIVAGLALIGGWQWWQARVHSQQVAAGEQYHAVEAAIAVGDLEQARSLAATLPQGSYQLLVALDLAKAQFEAGDTDAAIETLRAADGADPALEPVRRYRLAALLLEAGQAAQAVELLSGSDDPAALETLGDAQLALEQRDQARQSYAAALGRLDAAAPQRGLLELKLIDAGGDPAQSGAI